MYKSNSQTEYRLELRRKILQAAIQEFRTKGIKAVKMDDIANLLSVSKRTVYEIYENKEQLLMECVKEQNQCFKQSMQDYVDKNHPDVIQTLLIFYNLQMRNISDISPIYFSELHRYPQVVEWLECKHQENRENAISFFQRGIAEGYFRDDVNYELISNIFKGSMNFIMGDQLYKKYDLTTIFRDVIMLYMRGFCTMKGIEELERLLKQAKE